MNIRRVCDMESVELPDERVKSLDGALIDLGSKLYPKFSPSCREYEVVLPIALRHPNTKEWLLVVLAPEPLVHTMPVQLFVADPDQWQSFNEMHQNGENHRRRSCIRERSSA